MSSKNNFLPLLLIGGGAAAAALLYGFGTKKNTEDISVVDGLGSVGSGDFLASSGVSKGYDSVDLGIEDFANNRATADAFALPSDGANPEYVMDDSGEWNFNDTALLALSAVGAAPAAYSIARAAGSKVTGTAAAQAVKSAGSAIASGSALKTAATTLLKRAGPVGAVATGIDALVGTANAAEAQFNEQEIFEISQNISTDLAAKVGIGNMVSESQLQHASGLSGAKYPISLASKEETALVNKAVGLSSGDVLKVSGNKFTSYVPEKGQQIAFSNGATLAQAVSPILKRNAGKGA